MSYPKFFRKVVKGGVFGVYINSRGNEDEFALKGDPNIVDKEDITLEITDEESEKYFQRQNKGMLVKGYLVEVTDGEIELDETNSVSDGFLKDLLKEPNNKVKKRALEFTSSIPVNRLLVFAEEQDKPIKLIEFIRNRLGELRKEEFGIESLDTVVRN